LSNVRILLVALAGIMREIVLDALGECEGVSVVGEVSSEAELPAALSRLDTELVIWRREAIDAPEIDRRLFADHPSLKVLVLEDDGRHGFLWELRPHREALGELSPSLLLATIRRSSSP
jgi:DNA-binding NarL/FixJ family response regulator